MRAADRRDQAGTRRRTGSDGSARLRGVCWRAGRKAQPFGAAALNAAPQECLRGGGDDAEPRTPAGDDRNIDGEFIAPGDELPRAVEGVDQNEAVGDALRQRTARRLLRHDTYAG